MYRVLICAAIASILSVPAKADETLRFRFTGHFASPVQRHEVGDVAGHFVGLFDYHGVAMFPEGTREAPGVLYWTGTFDYINRNGSYLAYVTLTLHDGSVLWYKQPGNSEFNGTLFSSAGTVSVLGGKGQFEGAKGDGTAGGFLVGTPETGGDQFGEVLINLKN